MATKTTQAQRDEWRAATEETLAECRFNDTCTYTDLQGRPITKAVREEIAAVEIEAQDRLNLIEDADKAAALEQQNQQLRAALPVWIKTADELPYDYENRPVRFSDGSILIDCWYCEEEEAWYQYPAPHPLHKSLPAPVEWLRFPSEETLLTLISATL